jgi:hypothetical protein
VCDGVVATINVLDATSTVVAAGTPPKLTVAPGTKFVPVMVTVVPPLADPEFGTTLVTVGAGPANGSGSCGTGSRPRISLLDRIRKPVLIDFEFAPTTRADEGRFPSTVSAGAIGGGGS